MLHLIASAYLYPKSYGVHDEVRVGICAVLQRISDDQERHIFVFRGSEDIVRQSTISQDNVLAVESRLLRPYCSTGRVASGASENGQHQARPWRKQTFTTRTLSSWTATSSDETFAFCRGLLVASTAITKLGRSGATGCVHTIEVDPVR